MHGGLNYIDGSVVAGLDVVESSVDEHGEEVHDVDGVLERGEWIHGVRHVGGEDHGDVAAAHLVAPLLPRHVCHQLHRPVQQRRLRRRQPRAQPRAVVAGLAPRHLRRRQRVQHPAGELAEPGLDEPRQAVHVHAALREHAGVELLPDGLLLGVVGGDAEDALRLQPALLVEPPLHQEEDARDAVPPRVVRALHRLRRHAEHRLAAIFHIHNNNTVVSRRAGRRRWRRRRRLPCAGGVAGDLGLELDGEALEAMEPVEGDVGDVADVGGPTDLHRRLLLAAVNRLHLLDFLAAAGHVHCQAQATSHLLI